MRKSMHAKTLALVLATTTTLQVTGLASKLVNGEAFIKANAESGSVEVLGNIPGVTTSAAAVMVIDGPDISVTTPGHVKLQAPIISGLTFAELSNDFDTLYFELDVTTSAGAKPVTATAEVDVNWTHNGEFTKATTSGSAVLVFAEGYQLQGPVSYSFEVSISGAGEVDKSDLIAIISTAKTKYNAAEEGTEIGQYEVGTKAIFKQAIDAAQAVVDNDDATQEEVDAQVDALSTAVGVFEAAKITDSEVEMPSTVIIKGTEKVGKTLTAQLIKEDKNTGKTSNFTPSGEVTYAWYRLDNKKDSITEGKKVGKNDDEYKLTGNDKGKYIKVIATYNGETFDDITSRIAKKSSSSSSSSSSNDDDDNSSNSSNNGSSTTTGTSTATLSTSADGTVKLVDKNGQPATGWQLVNGVWYLGDASGTALTGWQQVNGTWYLMDSTGVMQTGWQLANGKWYLLNSSGTMATGWQLVNGKWYLLNSDGAMATGWKQTNGKWYYLYSDGSMASNTVIDGYTLSENGAWIQ